MGLWQVVKGFVGLAKGDPAPRPARRRPAGVHLRGELLETRVNPTGTFTQLANPVAANVPGVSRMQLLSDGDVLGQGYGTTAQFYLLSPDAQGDYVFGTWSAAGPMNVARSNFPANLLPSGNLFVLGGEQSNAGNFTNTDETYDPATNTWTSDAPFPLQNYGDVPTELLANGQILAGNIGPYTTNGYNINPGSVPGATYLFTPSLPDSRGNWSQTGTKFHADDESDEESWVLLPDGSVLSYAIFSSIADNTFEADRYIPAGNALPTGGTSTGQWADASAVAAGDPLTTNNEILSTDAVGDELGAALLLPPNSRHPDPSVFQIGANQYTAFFDTTTDVWTAGPTLPVLNGVQLSADDAPAAILPNGNVLMALSPEVYYTSDNREIFGETTAVYEFDPSTNVFTQVSLPASLSNALAVTGSLHTHMLDLPNGHVLFSVDHYGVWDYVPDGAPQSNWQPTISGITGSTNGYYTLTGTQLTGLSEGAGYGDDAEMSSNYPIVKLTEGGISSYATTSLWTPSVATGSAITSTLFTIPGTPAAGAFSVQVIANGIASSPTALTTPSYYYNDYWVDSRYANLSSGTAVSVDPVGSGYAGYVGQNAFGTVGAAITAAEAAGGGTVVVDGADSATGSTGDFSGEAVALSSSASDTVSLYLQDGPVQFGSLAGTGTVVLSSGVNLSTGYDNTNTEFDGTISGVGSLTKVGSGIFKVTGSVAPLGGLTISGGRFQPGTATAATALVGTTVEVDTDFGLDLQNLPAGTPVYLGGLSGSGALPIYGTAVTIGADNANTVYSGNLSSGPTAGSLGKIGSGILALDGLSNAVAGGTTVSDGVLLVNVSLTGTLGSPTGGLAVTYDGSVELGSANALANITVELETPASNTNGLDLDNLPAATLGGLITFGYAELNLGGTVLSVGQVNDSTDEISGPVIGTGGSIVKIGSGQLQFGDYSATTSVPVSVNSGSVTPEYGVALEGSTVTVNSGGLLSFGAAQQPSYVLGGLAGAGPVNFGNAAVTVGGDDDSTSYSGSLTAGSLTKIGNGSLTLPGGNSWSLGSGGVTINGGVVFLESASLLSAVTVTVNVNQGLNIGDMAAVTLGALAGSGNLTLGTTNTPNANWSVGANGANTTYSGVFTGTGTLSMNGGGTMTLSGSSVGVSGPYIAVVINAGALGFMGTTYVSTVTVNSGGAISGTGTVGGSVTVNGGTVQGGTATSGGTLTIWSLSFISGNLVAELWGSGNYDQIYAPNYCDVTNATFTLTLAPGFTDTANDQFDILYGVNRRAVTFNTPFDDYANNATITFNNQQFTITYDGHSIVLTYQ